MPNRYIVFGCFILFSLSFTTIGFKPLPSEDAQPEEIKRLFEQEKEAKRKIIAELKRQRQLQEQRGQEGVVKRERSDIILPAKSKDEAEKPSTEAKPGEAAKGEGIGSSVREPVHPISIQQKIDKERLSMAKEKKEPLAPTSTMGGEIGAKQSGPLLLIVILALVGATIYLIISLYRLRSKREKEV